MSFLFPLYLLGALAIALPVLLHLRKRPPREKIPFGSLMFLEKSPEKLTRRTRIERWLLLALRCLALLALALVFGRPFLKSTVLPSELPDASIAVILVDRSASMQREDLAAQAVKAAAEAIRSRKMEDEIAVLFFDRDTQVIADFEEWKALDSRTRAADFRKRVAKLPNSWDVSNPGKALIEAADRIASQSSEKEFRNRDVVLISDFKEGANFDAINQFAWPENISVECVPISPAKKGNFSLTLAATSEESRSAAELVHRVRISNAADSDADRFELAWKGVPDSQISGVIPPGSSRVLTVTSPPDSGNSGELVVSGDAHDYDNTVYIAPPQPVPLLISFFSSAPNPDQVGSPYFYLKRALHPTASLLPKVEMAEFPAFDEKTPESAAIIIHGEWTVELGEKARTAAETGKLVMALPTSRTKAEAFGKLFDVEGVSLAENDDEKYAMLASLDFEHPVLAPFARARIRDFTKVRFWKYRELTFSNPSTMPADIQQLAKFDSGTPAWIVRKTGQGSVFAFLSGWEPRESQFALSSKFVPILYSIFENAGYSAKAAPTSYVGESEIMKEGKVVTSTRPGLFPASGPNDSQTQIGINLHPSEGRVDPIDPHHLLREFNIPLRVAALGKVAEKAPDPTTKKRLEKEQKEEKQKLWKWLVIAVLLFLIAETWLSGRRVAVKEPVAT